MFKDIEKIEEIRGGGTGANYLREIKTIKQTAYTCERSKDMDTSGQRY